MTVFAVFFPLAALLALAGLCALALHDAPRISGTVAFVLTLAAFGAVTLR